MNKHITIKQKQLEQNGFICGPRDPRINQDFPGAFMVAESYDAGELPTRDGSNGPWCIVGDDLEALIEEAWEIWQEDFYAPMG